MVSPQEDSPEVCPTLSIAFSWQYWVQRTSCFFFGGFWVILDVEFENIWDLVFVVMLPLCTLNVSSPQRALWASFGIARTKRSRLEVTQTHILAKNSLYQELVNSDCDSIFRKIKINLFQALQLLGGRVGLVLTHYPRDLGSIPFSFHQRGQRIIFLVIEFQSSVWFGLHIKL